MRVLCLAGLCALISARAAAEETVETEHYRLHCEAPKETAEEYSRVLEAAYAGFEEFFGATPRLGKRDKLVVRFFQEREDWAKALIADQAVPPLGGGYYWTKSKTAYLYRQPTNYYTRVLLIHEAAHQFHYLARTNNQQLAYGWYREGTAEYLAAHFWDGETLKLGVLPLCSLKDYAAKALEQVKAKEFSLDAFVKRTELRDSERPVGWAIYRFVASDGFRGYAKWKKKMDTGSGAGPAFKRAFGRGKKLQQRFVSWLEANQEPWKQVWNEWQGIGETRLRGFANVISAARPKRPVTELSVRLDPPKGEWRAGILLQYVSAKDYSMAQLRSNGQLVVERCKGGAWQTLATKAAPPPDEDGSYRLKAVREKGRVRLIIGSAEGSTEFGPWEMPGDRFGLAIQNCDVRFHQVQWK